MAIGATLIRPFTGTNHFADFTILKSDNLHIAGYASIEMVDKQNDLITLNALGDAVKKFMNVPRYRNVMSNHSNVQVGEVVKEHRDSSGKIWKTEVDDVGFFVVIKLRDDIEKAKEVSRSIRNGGLRSFSIGGQAIHKKKKTHEDLGDYNEISKLELHEVTICEKGINAEAKFDILKQEKGETMNIDNALQEINTLIKQIENDRVEKTALPNNLEDMLGGKTPTVDSINAELASVMGGEIAWGEAQRVVERAGISQEDFKQMAAEHDLVVKNEGENMTEELLDTEGEGEDMEYMSAGEGTNEEEVGKTDLAYGAENPDETGEVIHDGTPRSKHPQINVSENTVTVKAYDGDTPSLNLSEENLEKAYSQFKAEQMEKMAYQDIKSTFETRLEKELSVKKARQSKESYDAQLEVNELKKQFSELLSAIKDDKETVIMKQQQVASQLPTFDDISKMDWSDIHSTLDKLTGGI
jgi:HK97 family phage prohead protease